MNRLAFVVLLGATTVLGACREASSPTPTDAEQAYGTALDATDAVPVSAIAAEADRHLGRPVTVDGRIAAVTQDGCALLLATDEAPPLRVTAPRPNDGDSCGWQVPLDTDGFVVAAGTLRATNDTLHLSATGVQVPPFRPSDSPL